MQGISAIPAKINAGNPGIKLQNRLQKENTLL